MASEFEGVGQPDPADGDSGARSDAQSTADVSHSVDEAREAVEKIKSKKRQDPVVRNLILAIIAIVILTLITALWAMLTGVFGTGAPRTSSQQKVLILEGRLAGGNKDREDWVEYIDALIEAGEYRKAEEAIKKGKATLEDQEVFADMVYMQSALYLEQGELDKSLKLADEALKTIKTEYEAAKKVGGANKAYSFGISPNYWELLLIKAEIHEKQKKWTEALAAYDEFLKDPTNATSASIFTMRGKVKEKLGDTKGAEKDFRKTLVFIKDDAEALAGLERIGADK